ncbi:hypothetical protein HHI36_009014 [Cryptolaemus montrouzieri]|uniref:Uncharacterized protein n=1 Tax=Cryptolaemus montrouzieri TaxID=559131 RepID=A0ABD2MUW4_9CUCU
MTSDSEDIEMPSESEEEVINEEPVNPEHINIGDFLLIKFEKKKTKKAGSSKFIFPIVEDKASVDVRDVVLQLPKPTFSKGTSRTSSLYSFSFQEKNKNQNIYKVVRPTILTEAEENRLLEGLYVVVFAHTAGDQQQAVSSHLKNCGRNENHFKLQNKTGKSIAGSSREREESETDTDNSLHDSDSSIGPENFPDLKKENHFAISTEVNNNSGWEIYLTSEMDIGAFLLIDFPVDGKRLQTNKIFGEVVEI